MPVWFLPRPVPCLPARLLVVALLLAVTGCMGRWELGDVGGLPYPRAEPQPRSGCATGGPVPCGERSRAAGTPLPGTSR